MTGPEDRIHADINKLGWHVVLMPEGDKRPAWGFTVGLFAKFRHPELALFGLPIEDLKSCLDTAARNVRAGTVYADGDSSSDLFDDCACVFRKVAPNWYRAVLPAAFRFYGGMMFPALQGFFPDSDGSFPWEPGCADGVKRLQPALYIAEGGPPWLLALLDD